MAIEVGKFTKLFIMRREYYIMAKKSLEERGYKPGDVIKEFSSGRIKVRIVYEGKVS